MACIQRLPMNLPLLLQVPVFYFFTSGFGRTSYPYTRHIICVVICPKSHSENSIFYVTSTLQTNDWKVSLKSEKAFIKNVLKMILIRNVPGNIEIYLKIQALTDFLILSVSFPTQWFRLAFQSFVLIKRVYFQKNLQVCKPLLMTFSKLPNRFWLTVGRFEY